MVMMPLEAGIVLSTCEGVRLRERSGRWLSCDVYDGGTSGDPK